MKNNACRPSSLDPDLGPDPDLDLDAGELAASAAWWARTRESLGAFEGWLYDQYRGERRAAARIAHLRDTFAVRASAPRAHRVLSVIAEQEAAHASWIAELLTARGLPVAVQDEPERYWPHVLAGIRDLATAAAVGAHAERMRLARIAVIAADEDAPADVRSVFQRILPQERFHERAFRELAGKAALDACRDAHELGRRALGLRP